VATAATQSSSRSEGGELLVLGIESTAHTFGVAVVSSSPPYILSDVRRSYRPEKGGILPREVAAFFSKNAGSAVGEALQAAGVRPADLSAVAVALGPGLGPALRVGATVARALASAYGKPLVPVNHAVAHIEIARFTTGLTDPLIVYVSGGNTTVTTFADGRYRVFGETLDIALGNLLDTFAREAGIAPPYVVDGRHAVDVCAEGGDYVEGLLPYIVKGQDVSYSGLLTAALRALERLGRSRLPDICFTLREIAYSAIVEVAERGLAHTGKSQLTLTGGVAASDLLREKLGLMAESRGVDYKPVPKRYAGDNGVMIALTGLLAFRSGVVVEPGRAFIRQRWRLDEVDIPWYPSTLTG
jgi:N6-L-threonylcarbamoyladenine synthase